MNRFILLLLILVFALNLSGQRVKWYTLEEAAKLTKTEPRKIVIDVYTDWCRYCKIMDQTTFENEIISEYLNKNFYPVKFNAEQTDSVTIENKTFKFVKQGTRGYHELAIALLKGKLSYPSVVFLDEKLTWLNYSQGLVQPKEFDIILNYFAQNKYKEANLGDFAKTYKSPFTE